MTATPAPEHSATGPQPMNAHQPGSAHQPVVQRTRVLVPRGGEPGDRLAAAVEAAGFAPRIVPLISFVPPEDPGPLQLGLRDIDAGAFDWLILTSERTVDALLGHTSP